MAKILLDESFYYRNNADNYIYQIIDFISTYFEDDIALFHPYCNTGNLWMLQNEIATIEKKIIKTGKYYICDENLIEPIEFLNDISKLEYKPEFMGKINYIKENFDNVILFTSPEKHRLNIKRPCEHVYIVNHIMNETNSNIAFFIINDLFMFNNIVEPNLESPLPNINLCKEYYNYLTEQCKDKDKSSRTPLYLEIGSEVLQRNKYEYDSRATGLNKNSGVIRNIYSFGTSNNTIYASIDVENGAIEICNYRGKHQDEYTYNNTPQNKRDKTGKHDIKV